jgi:anaerobic magnesium-protoporphyrin IX monomethyl ester cyclase
MATVPDKQTSVDVLFTHSYHLAYDRKQAQKQQPYPPLGTLYAAALAREAGFSVALFDTMIEDPDRDFDLALEKYQPKIVVICEDSFNFLSKMCLSRMREVSFDMRHHAAMRGIPTIVHGSDSSDHTQTYLDQGFLAVMLGECEQTIVELLGAYLHDGQHADWKIPGLTYLRSADGSAISTGARTPSKQLDRYPLPLRSLVDMDRYATIWRIHHGRASTNIVASRGCPFRCNWCAKPIYGNKFVLRSAKSVATEMYLLKNEYGVEHLWFADDVFALDRHWILEFAEAVEALDAAIPFKIQSRADLMSEETVDALRRAGCEEIWMGVESGSQSILDAMDKGLKVSTVRGVRELLRFHGIRASFFLQFGYPGEQLEEIEETIALVRSCRPDDIGVSVSYPLPGTGFYQKVQDQLGAKQNWVDSEDLTVMFRAAYTDKFYLALRNALHAEVSYYSLPPSAEESQRVAALWDEVYRLEKSCRNPRSMQLPIFTPSKTEDLSLCASGD